MLADRAIIPHVSTARSTAPALLASLLLAACAVGQPVDSDGGGSDDGLYGEGNAGRDLPTVDGASDLPATDLGQDLPGPDATPPDDLPAPPDQPISGTIKVLAPTTGSHTAGSSLTVTWTGTGAVGNVHLELWRGSKKFVTVAQNRPKSGSLTWKIPTSTPGGAYRVRVSSASLPKIFGFSQTFTVVNFSYRVTVSINATKSKTTLVNYPVAVPLAAKTFPYAHARSDGADLRFSLANTPGSAYLPHWIQQYNPKGASVLWVKVPKLQAGKTTNLYLFYGHAKAGASSSKSKTFPKMYVSKGGVSLSGNLSYDWFEIKAGHVLTLPSQKMLTVTARRIVVQGVVQGNGAGFPGGAGSGQSGKGPGGGSPGSGAGGGGGGHGGSGGKGGYDGTDNPGNGGQACGSPGGASNLMGSGGGAGGPQQGGNGGGALSLSAHDVVLSGAVLLDGTAGKGGAQSGGGGSGGGVLVRGHDVTVAGNWSVRGGAGGSGSSTANDGGGGGGGGRVKLLYGNTLSNKVSSTLFGGAGGKYGGKSHGLAGGIGTFSSAKTSYSVTSVLVGPEAKL